MKFAVRQTQGNRIAAAGPELPDDDCLMTTGGQHDPGD
jgi:hypothetical protein